MRAKKTAIAVSLLVFASRSPASPGEIERLSCPALRCTDEIVNVKASPFGARGDGIADDTAAIQSALDSASTVLVPAGTFLVSLDDSGAGLRLLRDDVTLILDAGATLRLRDAQIPVGTEGEVVAVGDGSTPVHRVAIRGEGEIDGNRATNHGNVENSSGIRINAGATDVVIDVVLIPEGERLTFHKQPPLGGAGGNPLIYLQFLTPGGQALTDYIKLGRCNKI